MTSLQSTIERKLLPFVEKPLRYNGGELNVIKKDLQTVKLHGVLCFPDLYDLGMSHLGLQILYHRVNKHPEWALSRCFAPWIDAEKRMRELGIPLFSLEYYLPMNEADWIGFSVQYELQYTNIINMLDLAGIPLYSRQRVDDPIVIAGGPCVGNPEPLADFIDAFALGDGEETIIALCRVMEQGKQESWAREKTLKALAALPGVYVPSLFPVVKKGGFLVPDATVDHQVRAAKVARLLPEFYPEKPLVPLMNVVHHRLGIEVMRGCTHGCRFCAAGVYYRPVREKEPLAISKEIEQGIAATGWRDVGLMSLSSADYSCLSTLLGGSLSLKERYRIAFSLPSTRIDALDSEHMDLLTSVCPVSSLTIAPEAGSERLRRVINKDFTDEAIFLAVKTLLSRNVQTIKLYFMIGLPTETEDDIKAIIAMVKVIAGLAQAVSHRRSVNVSLSPFSPKAHTPFQWERMESNESLEKKNLFIKGSLRHLKNVRVSYRRIAMTRIESIMARGDRSVAALILGAWRRGARFDGWDEQFRIERYDEAAREASVDCSLFIGAIPLEQELPWRVLSTGVTQEYLAKERERALAGEITPDCRIGDCLLCGVCNAKTGRRIIGRNTEGMSAGRPVTYGRFSEKTDQMLHRYRFLYGKGPAVRFLGHLDMVAIFIRALIASGCRLVYSQGFQPHPKISFGPPLACGLIAHGEAFEATTMGQFDGAVETINAMLPHDLCIQSFSRVKEHGPSLTASIKAAIYRFTAMDGQTLPDLKSRIASVLNSPELPITIIKDEKTVIKNIRPLIKSLSMETGSDERSFLATLSMEPGATCKPLELIKALFPGKEFTDFLVDREHCLVDQQGRLTPVELCLP